MEFVLGKKGSSVCFGEKEADRVVNNNWVLDDVNGMLCNVFWYC